MNKLSLFYVILCSLLSVTSGVSQDNQSLNFRIGILTEAITHPGLNIGVSKHLGMTVKEKNRKKGTFQIHKELLFLSNIGIYQHIDNHTGLLYGISIARRRKADYRRISHLYGFGLGGLTQVNAGITYELQDNGDVEESSLKSRTYVHPHIIYELGYPFSTRVKGYTRIQLGVKAPYNTYFSIVPLIESGIRFSLKQNKVK